MVAEERVPQKKKDYRKRLAEYLQTYDKAFIVHADNVGSKQFMDIRKALRPQSVILMGKNTMMRFCVEKYLEETNDTRWECLVKPGKKGLLEGNVGIVFTNGDLSQVKDEIAKYKVGAPARVGAQANEDVTVKSGTTGMDPSQTSFFQALGIATKINKGTIEIVSDVVVVKTGDRVGPSQATLLAKLGIKPFKYGLLILKVIESGTVYDPAVMDITDDDILAKVITAIREVAALSLGAKYPTLAAAPHLIVDGYKNVLALALETDYTFPLAQKVKDYLADPSKFAVAAAPAAGAAAPAAKKEEPKKEEPSEEEDLGFSLFD
ncbi:60S acidic ribosomal protein P0 [Tetrabaena socialis]|uniref:60S acidic ribosomal protein P0 n=1 Tax=Tetrabaena socialis TaxID=47790 RepID=A0A2J8AGT3_9CHLO|nr:60S acidic ribosomal protein P0 [Tetrabaena socialis]|eukprot:PNH11706.1 60S acidic ribosomal protein P0 [Tetrabaena socialis]